VLPVSGARIAPPFLAFALHPHAWGGLSQNLIVLQRQNGGKVNFFIIVFIFKYSNKFLIYLTPMTS
jgi:hypothetical protein